MVTRIPANLQSWLAASAANKRQVTSTVYDQADLLKVQGLRFQMEERKLVF